MLLQVNEPPAEGGQFPNQKDLEDPIVSPVCSTLSRELAQITVSNKCSEWPDAGTGA